MTNFLTVLFIFVIEGGAGRFPLEGWRTNWNMFSRSCRFSKQICLTSQKRWFGSNYKYEWILNSLVVPVRIDIGDGKIVEWVEIDIGVLT